MSVYCVMGSAVGVKDIEVNKIVKIPASYGLQVANAIPFYQIALFYCLHVLTR